MASAQPGGSIASRGVDALLLWARALVLGPVLFGACGGAGIWALTNPQLLPQLAINRPRAADVQTGLLCALVVAGLFVALAFAHRRFARRTLSDASLLDSMARLRRVLAPSMTLPLLVFLRVPGLERDRPELTLFLIAVVATASAISAYAWPERRAQDANSAFAGHGALVLVGSLWVVYACFFSRLAILSHEALHTRTADLGYYDNTFYQTIHGRLLGCSFLRGGTHSSAHFDPILILLAPLYWLQPRAELLLVLQSIWLGAGVVPVFLIARRKLKSASAGLIFAVSYVLYPALHGANLYEFHSLALIVPLLLWLLFFLETERRGAYFVVLGLLLLCREDVPLLLAFVGIYGISHNSRTARTGWLTLAISLGYWLLVKLLVAPSAQFFNGGARSYGYDFYYQELIPNNRGLLDLLASLVTNPAFVVAHVLTEPKLRFVLLLFAPLLFLPLAAKPGRLMLGFGALACLLSSDPAMSSVHFYYASLIFPVAFALAPEGLAQITKRPLIAAMGLDARRLARALLAVCLVTSALISWKFGAILENQSFRAGAEPVVRSLSSDEQDAFAWIEETARRIPLEAALAVSSRTGPHASNRRFVTLYSSDAQFDYAWLNETDLTPAQRASHEARIARGELEELSRRGALVLFRHNPQP
jgi:uncharacterized membrane protein